MVTPQETQDWLSKNLFVKQGDVSQTDKLLSRDSALEIQNIMKKEDLTRSDLNQLLYLLGGLENKVLNLTEQERYILAKFFTWIRDFAGFSESLAGIMSSVELADANHQIIEECRHSVNSSLKFLVDVFLYISRSSLSVKGWAFETLSTSRYEYAYPTPPVENKSVWSRVIPGGGKKDNQKW